MKRIPAVVLLVCLFAYAALARQAIFAQPLSPRIANYVIDVTFDAKEKMLHGTETLTWKNTSKDKITELQFHLYLNGFKNSESTFMKESGGQHRGAAIGSGWGWIDIDKIAIVDGEDLKPGMAFIQPDDGNPADQTVVRVPLTKPILPGRSISLAIAFTAKLPAIFARTGVYQDYVFAGQWFPKIGVYEPAGMRFAERGQWNCHQFHSNTEFYADYGTYDVSVNVPGAYVVGATGLVVRDKVNSDGTRTAVFHAEDVHDFAWTASPHYVAVDDKWKHVQIRLLMQPDRVAGTAPRYMESVKATLAYLDKAVGPYPYPNVTVVDPAYGAMGSGGMEYPTLITAGSFWGLPEGARFAEVVTVHEFGHQYFYGLIGSNEFEEAWLDEGFNQYYETRIMDDVYGLRTGMLDLMGYQSGDLAMTRSGYTGLSNPKLEPTGQPAFGFKAGLYGAMTYQKTATFMATLERMVGRSVFDEAMQSYFKRWRFGHPCARDFFAVMNEVVTKHHGDKFGKDLSWYFDQVLYGTNVCDYELSLLDSRPVSRQSGMFDKGGKKVNAADLPKDSAAKMYETKVRVSRLGEMTLPVDVEVKFEDGSLVRERWDGMARFTDFKYIRSTRVLSAAVDPQRVVLMDVNLNNNSRTLESESAAAWKYAMRFMFWVQNLMLSASMF